MLFEFSISLDKEITRLLGSYKIIVPSTVVDELKTLSTQGNGKTAQNAKSSINLLKRYDIREITASSTDTSLLKLAQQLKGYILTNDKELRKRCKKHFIPVLYLRAKKKLALEEV